VTSFNIERNEVCWFSKERSPHLKLLDALLSTCAAPTYFPIHCFNGEYDGKMKKFSCVDGGIWGNDPRLYAFFHRRVVINSYVKHKTYNIISFGTGQFKTEDQVEEPEQEDQKKEDMGNKNEEKEEETEENGNKEEEETEENGNKEEEENEMEKVKKKIKTVTKVRGDDKSHKVHSEWDSTTAWLLGNPNIIEVILNASTAMVDNMFETIHETGLVKSTKVQVILKQQITLDDVKAIKKIKKVVEDFSKENPDVIKAAVDHTMFMGGVAKKIIILNKN